MKVDVAKPTPAQAAAGNYRKTHLKIHGLDVAIETPRGRARKHGWPRMAAHYGYVKRTRGADGDHLDVFVGPHPESQLVVVIDQVDESGQFDEHKALLGYTTEEAAVAAYRKCYAPGWKVGPVSTMTIKQFKAWLDGGTQKHPIFQQVSRYAVLVQDAIVDYYAARNPKNSPGQLGLFGNGPGREKLRSAKTQQSLNWDEAKHPRDEEGKFAEKGSGTASGKQGKRDKKSFVYPNGQTQAFGDDGNPDSPEGPEAPQPDPPNASPLDDTPETDQPSDLFGDSADTTPRDQAEQATDDDQDDYEFARKSAVPNAGEDLKGSARHKVNAWRTLEEAESEGTAAKLVTRDQLLKNEPHNLSANAHRAPLTTLAMHLAMKAFPAKPGAGVPRYKPDPEQAKHDRKQYVEAYRKIKEVAEDQAKKGDDDPRESLSKLKEAVRSEIDRLRTEDRYNATANSLVDLHGKLYKSWNKTSVPRQLRDFAEMEKAAHDEMPPADRLEAMSDKVLDVLEGKSVKAAFGKKSGGKAKFNAADMYVGQANREGGPEMPADNATTATEYLVSQTGFRGVQFGNSVSDDERKHHATMAAAAMLDLADVTGLPLDAIGLHGKLGLAIGARGKGRALAHYEPGEKVINLTRKKGVGSLAHEWAHAFDHEMGGGGISRDSFGASGDFHSESRSFGYQRREDGGMEQIDTSDRPTGQPMADVRNAFRDSGFHDRLGGELRKMRMSSKAQDYWRSPKEMFARCFERYVQRKLEKSGRKNTYLAGIESKAYKEGGLWPTNEEVDAMAPAFEKLLDSHREHNLGIAERVKYSAAERNAFIERFVARHIAEHMERYAAKGPKNSPGQKGLFGDGLGGDQLRSAKRQKKIQWDESKHPRASDVRFGTKPGIHKSPEKKLLGSRGGDAKVLGGMLYDQLENKKPVSLLGKQVSSAKDLGSIAQVYRDPRFETLRAFFVKDGKIVGQNAYSSRMAGVVMFPPEMKDRMAEDLKNLEADGFYMLHNHPSGNPDPSREDVAFTRQLKEDFGDQMLGHTIIDHNKGSTIDGDGKVDYYDQENENLQDRSKATVPHELLENMILSTEELGQVAMKLGPPKDRAVVVFTSVKGKVQLLLDVSKESLKRDDSQLLGALRRISRMTSSTRRFLVLPEGEKSGEHDGLISRCIFTDIAEEGGKSARERGATGGADPLEQGIKAYETARERFEAPRWKDVDHLVNAGFWVVDQYRTEKPSPGSHCGDKKRESSGADKTPKTVKGSFGDTGRFVTIEGHPVFIRDEDGQINRGPRHLKGRNAREFPDAKGRNKHQKTERSDRFSPKTRLDQAIVDAVGDHPDDVEAFRGYMQDAHQLLTTEHAETMDAMRNLLAHFGYNGRAA